MASVVALLTKSTHPKHGPLVAGQVLPIDHYLFTGDDDDDRSDQTARIALSRGGALYLVAMGTKHELWLAAVLEAPECSQIKPGDRRKPAGTRPQTRRRLPRSRSWCASSGSAPRRSKS